MTALTRELRVHVASATEWRREAKRFLTLATVVALVALAAIFVSLVVVNRGDPGSIVRRTYEMTIGVEFAALVVLVFILRARLRRDMGRYERQFELLDTQTQRLRETSDLLQTVLDSSPLAIYAMDSHLNVLLWNPAAERLFGWKADEVVGKRNPLSLGAFAPDSSELRERILGGDGVASRRGLRTRKDGTTVEIFAAGAPIDDGHGTSGYIVVASDLSEQAKLEAQLRQAQKMEAVGLLAGGVAHDFNNLLTVITSYSELLLLSRGGAAANGDRTADQLREIKLAADRAAALTRQLLAFSRQQVMHPRVLDLNDIVGGVQRMLGRLLGADIALTSHLDPDLGMVRADPGQIEQVLVNLAINARDAMPDGGRLEIATTNIDLDDAFVRMHDTRLATGAYVSIVVSDTGTGMAADVRERIFEPFFTTKEPGKGTGLGLSTALGIVEQSGGSMFVYSEPGHGTTFRIYLPRLAGDEGPSADREMMLAGTGGSETVLLVEDEAAVRRVAHEILGSAGYTVLEAANGVEAIHAVEKHYRKIDLVVTDVVMPSMGGPDLWREMRDRLIDLPVLYMSGYARSTLTSDAVAAPNSAFIEKPFAAATLLRAVRQLLDRTPTAA